MRILTLVLGFCLLAFSAAWADGDPESGAGIFKRFCKQCHVPIPGDPLAAPKLNGIIDRPVADAPDYRYSKAFRAKRDEGLIWTEQNLRDFLRDPRGYIPGSIMVFNGVKRASHRDDLIAYLRSLPTE